jgi:tetratricopeptide (TPR) repeat protein
MDRPELAALLNQGIAAVRSGDRLRARELLLRVVEADDRIEPAWFWLAAALDAPADQLAALENVLALNPGHARARDGVRALRQQLGLPDEAEPAAAASQSGLSSRPPETPAPPTPAEPPHPPSTIQALAAPSIPQAAARLPDAPVDEEDPDQCAYCGRPVDPQADRCPHCRRGLLAPGLWRAGAYQYLLLMMVGLHLQAGMLQALIAYLQADFPRALEFLDFLPLDQILTANPFLPAVVRVIAWVAVLMMLLNDSLAAYPWAAGLAVLDLSWAGGGYASGLLAIELAAIVAVFAVGIGLTALVALLSQAQARRRLRVVPDRGLGSAPLLHRRAEHYARRGQWALAALHWQRAIVRQPREPSYYKALGRAQARLGRTESALRSFRSGAELAPDDPDFPRLIQSVLASRTSR